MLKLRVRAGEYHVMLGSGEIIPPHQEVEVRVEEAYALVGQGLVVLLSSPAVETAVAPPKENRVVPIRGVARFIRR